MTARPNQINQLSSAHGTNSRAASPYTAAPQAAPNGFLNVTARPADIAKAAEQPKKPEAPHAPAIHINTTARPQQLAQHEAHQPAGLNQVNLSHFLKNAPANLNDYLSRISNSSNAPVLASTLEGFLSQGPL